VSKGKRKKKEKKKKVTEAEHEVCLINGVILMLDKTEVPETAFKQTSLTKLFYFYDKHSPVTL